MKKKITPEQFETCCKLYAAAKESGNSEKRRRIAAEIGFTYGKTVMLQVVCANSGEIIVEKIA